MSIHGVSGKDAGIVGVLISLVAIALAVVAMASSGTGGGGIITAKLSGIVTATWSSATTYVVIGSVTFSPTFTSIPTITVTTRNVNFLIPVTGGSPTFFAVESTGIMWLNMPVAKTEIFGDTGQHQTEFNLAAITSATWCVNILTISNSVTAVLRPEYSLDLVNWFELAAVTTTLDVNIGGATGPNCVTVAVPIANGAKGQSVVYLRLVGLNGGGVGDSPVFSIASMILYTGLQFVPTCGENLAPTTTAFSWRCMSPVAPGVSAPISVPVEWQAEVK